MAIIVIPRPLREKLGEEGADALIGVLNQVVQNSRGDILTFVEEKFEHRLSEEIAKVNTRLTEEISKINQRLTEEISKINQRISDEVGNVRAEVGNVRAEVGNVRADLIKWMFIFWVGQIAVMSGIFFAMLQLYIKP